MANRSNPTSDADLGRRLLLSGAAAAGALQRDVGRGVGLR